MGGEVIERIYGPGEVCSRTSYLVFVMAAEPGRECGSQWGCV